MQTQDKSKQVVVEKPKGKVNVVPSWPAGLMISRNERINVSINEDLAIILSQAAFEQLFGWAYSTSKEISCLGSVYRDGDRFFVDRFYLVRQSGCSVSTELNQSAVAELIEQLITEGNRDTAERIKCWAHSHPNMEPFWSKVDDTTCRLLVNDYLVSIVVGDNFAIRCRIDIATPVAMVLDNVPVLYQMPKDKLPLDKYAEQVRSIVSEKVYGITNAEEKQDQQDLFAPTAYCDCCGYCHGPGECPLGDPGKRSYTWDDDLPF